jgi:hypothetical protein
MADGIRLDLQRALSEGPGSIPNLEPLFAPGAIPPTFDEAPEVQEGPGFAPEEQPIAPPGASIGQPVPAVKESRGDRLRALLGNFLQNFGTGLQAASRAPSGAEFAAGFGGALSASEERRQQKSREELLRANQASREQQAREIQELREDQFAFQRQQAEAGRIERENVRAGAERRTFQERLRARTERTADIVAGRRGRAGQREFLRGQQRERLGATAEQGRLGRNLQRELAQERAIGRGGMSFGDAHAIASRETRIGISARGPLATEPAFKTPQDAIDRTQKRAIEIFKQANGIGPTKEELAAVLPRTAVVKDVLSDLDEARKVGFTDDELVAQVTRLRLSDELTEEEEELVLGEAGLLEEKLSQTEIFRSNIQRRKQVEESRKTRIPGTTPSFLRKIR